MKSLTDYILERKVITFGSADVNYGQCVILAGGAGSGKGYINNKIMLDAKTIDVDSLKSKYIEMAKAGKLQEPDNNEYSLLNPADVSKLHIEVAKRKWKQKQRSFLASGIASSNKSGDSSKIPNIIWDMVCKNIDDIQDIIDMADAVDMAGDAMDAFDAVDVMDAFDAYDVLDANLLDFDVGDMDDINIVDVGEGDDLLADSYGLNSEDVYSDPVVDHSNISFKAQYETIQTTGGKKLEVSITKEAGTANKFTISSDEGTVYHVKGGDKSVKINGFKYWLPKLKG